MKASTNTSTTLLGKLKITQTYASNKCAKKSGHYLNLDEARTSIDCWIEQYNHDRPHRGVGNRTPREAFLAFQGVLKNEALTA